MRHWVNRRQGRPVCIPGRAGGRRRYRRLEAKLPQNSSDRAAGERRSVTGRLVPGETSGAGDTLGADERPISQMSIADLLAPQRDPEQSASMPPAEDAGGAADGELHDRDTAGRGSSTA
jgi:hypothetical protein